MPTPPTAPTQPVTITTETDLKQFLGRRVRIERTLRGTRYVYYGVFLSLWHSHQLKDPVVPGLVYCGGMLREEPHGDCRGGETGFDLPYSNATVEFAEVKQ